MTKNKLPAYFEKYLQSEFDGIKNFVNGKFEDVNTRFDGVHEEIAVLRGEIGNIKLSSVIVGAVGGLLTAIGGFLGLQMFKK